MKIYETFRISPPVLLAVVFILSGLPFLLIELFPAQLYRVMDIESYLVFHNIAEFFSIMVSLSIFGIGWYTYGQSGDRHVLFLATAFLAIGLMDFMHTLGYAGMPAFITSNSANKSTLFWIAVRLFTATAFMSSACIATDNRTKWLSKPALMTGAIVSSILVFIVVIFFPGKIPATFIEGTGLTAFKKICEYVVIILLLITSALYWRRLKESGDGLILYYLSAFILCIYSELVFAVYKSVFDTYNMLGHAYKVLAFWLIYQGIFVASVKNPYLKLLRTEKKLELDIAERLRAEEAQREGERKLQLLAENIDDVFWMRTPGVDKITYISPACEKLWMKSIGSIYQAPQSFMDSIHPDDQDSHKEIIKQYHSQGKSYQCEYRIVRIDGSIRCILERGFPVYGNSGTVEYMTGTCSDITEHRRMEEELVRHRDNLEEMVKRRTAELRDKSGELENNQKALMNIVEDLNRNKAQLEQANLKLKEMDRLKSMFIASMSHELRTPLNSIIGFSSILHDEWLGKVNTEQKENLAIILNSGRHLLNLINDVIDVSKIEAGKIETIVEDFDLANAIEEATSLLSKEVKNKGLLLRLEMINLQMHTDRRRLLQCLINLLGNAVKFTERGSVSIEARKIKENLVGISVTDTGVGIRNDDVNKLFQPFVRLNTSKWATIPGTGLGLYLTRKLVVEILKGDITLSSEFGSGSRFSLRIPVRLP